MPKGYSGNVLRVNLNNARFTVEHPDELFYRRYLGGWGFVAYYLLTEIEPGIDPLGPDNKLVFAPGIFTGVRLSGSGRSAVGAKSPLTGGFGEGDVGGYFGVELAHAGWDAVIFEGKSEKPVYLAIQDDKYELKDASHVWGKDTWETQEMLKKELGDSRTRLAVIGPAGETQIPLSCIINDDNRAVGRTGLGAVMGSKNLKALAVRGTLGKEVHDEAKIKEIAKWMAADAKPAWEGRRLYGTGSILLSLNAGGGLPTRNFKEGQFEEAEKVSGPAMAETILVDKPTCYACVVRCKRRVEIPDGPYKTDKKWGGPEYETVGSFGTNCGIGDLAAISKANAICNAAGLDTIGAGMMVSFTMECFENGIIDEKDTGGIKANFGNVEAMLQLLEMLKDRKGIGVLLARGYKPCIEKWGKEAEKYAVHVKWQAFPMHEPRFKCGLGLGYAVSPTGADHMHNLHDTILESPAGLGAVRAYGVHEPLSAQDLSPAKVRALYYNTMTQTLKNMIGMCHFPPFVPNLTTEVVRAVTGWDTSLFELFKAAERGWTMARAFNIREGIDASADNLPDRFFEAFTSGPLKGKVHTREEFQHAKEIYYQLAGWDRKTGKPTEGKYADLALDWLAGKMAELKLVG
ncbi:MAG: aldehyde ferredoxin oxidoreductase family protein [Spirochaetales bacterium]|nr:aldehyde ferredoxin oxidoreductase family protein [Spirochaetales bacterium]